MEEKINIAEILKDKPQGTKLYSPIFGKLRYEDLVPDLGEFTVVTSDNTLAKHSFRSDSRYNRHGEPLMLLPSKEMRDWEKFSWKKGDVLISDCGFMCIFKEWASDDYTKFNGCYFDGMPNTETAKYSKVDNNIAYGYIRDIENRCGGKLNLETLEIEKQTKFKDGDIVCISGIGYLAYGIVKNIDNSSKKLEYYVLNDMSTLKFEDWLSFEDKHILPITETQQIILFDALAKKGKAWDAEKKQIVDIKKELQFKPFEKVLVRDSYNDMWRASFFSHIKEDDGRYVTTCCTWKFCIPYIGNESLVGTTKDVEG
jgi:hypothetical protein